MVKYRCGAAALLAGAALQAPAFAQTTSPAPASAADAGATGSTPEIVVTAERRNQDVLNTPISVVAMSADTLKARGVTDINSLQSAVPSVSFTDYGNVKFLNIRGVGISEGAPNQSVGVAVHWDGTYVAREFVFGDSFFDVASVEVLRGPQGTYTGQNASGGAIYINSVRPDFKGTSGFASAALGNLGHRLVEAGVTTQLSDQFAVRISGQLERNGSAFTNLGPTGAAGTPRYANQPGNLRRFIGRAQLLFKPSDDFDILIAHQYSDRQTDGLPTQSFALSTVGNRTVAYDADQALNTSYNRTSAVINYTGFQAFKVRLTGAYQTTDQLSIRDNDFTATRGGSSSKIILHDRYYTGELDLISPDNRPFTWTAGATFLNYRQPGITAPSVSAAAPFGSGLYIFTDATRKNEAVFAEIGYKPVPSVEIKLGGRYSWDHVGFQPSYIGFAGPVPPGPGIPLTPGVKDFSKFTGRAAINWEVADGQSLYATVSRGYKPGGTTPFGVNYDAETVTNYEAGWKSRMLGGALTTALSGFYMDYKGYQTTYTPDINNPATAITRNVDGTKIKGVEGQVTLNLDGFHGDAAFSVLDATYGHLNVVLPVGLYGNGLPAAPQLVDLNGRTIPFASKFSGAAGIAYDIPLGTGTITPSARVTRQSAQWVNFFQAAYNRIPARTLVSARLTYQAKHNWSVAAYANNLLDENYIATVDQSTNGTGSYVLGQPREYGVTMSYKF